MPLFPRLLHQAKAVLMSLPQSRAFDWQRRPVFLASLAVFLMLCIFLFDLHSDMRLAAGVLHVLPVMMATLLPWRHATLVFAGVASALSLSGFVLLLGEDPGSVSVLLGLGNRTLTLLAIWATAILGLLWIKKDRRLEEEQARLQAVIDTSADAVVTIDEGGIIQSFSRAGERLFGYRENEVIGRNVSMLMPSPHREAHDSYMERYLRTGEKRIIGQGRQVVAQRKNGETFPVHLMVGEIRSDSQRLFTGFIHDMSERVKAERAVARERNFVTAMLDTTEALVVVLDEHGRVIRSNRACQKVSGYAAEELAGKQIREFLPEEGAGFEHFLQASMDERSLSGRWEGELLCKDGERRLISWSVATIAGDEQSPRYLVATGIDMTEWRQSEARARDLQHHLYRIGRISELGEMASAIAHELNQPMTAVTNYVNASLRLVRSLENEGAGRVAELMTRAVEQTEKAGQIIRRLRQLIGRGQSELQPNDLNSVVEEALALALIGARQEDIEVKVALSEDLPPILADATQLQQVVLNLVRNAIEAMQAVEKRELVIASRQTEEGMVELSITDSGPGLDPEVASQLFMPFISTKAKGMGIGLAICRSIVDAHHGQIRAEPAEGGGTSFLVTLPAMTKQANLDE